MFFQQLNLSMAPLSQSHLAALFKDLADVERLLKDVDLLSGLARLLPKGACVGHTSGPVGNGTRALNATTWGPNTTDTPKEEGEDGTEQSGGDTAKEKEKEGAEKPHSQFSAFVQLWAGLQPILCGNNRWVESRRYTLTFKDQNSFKEKDLVAVFVLGSLSHKH